MKMAGYDTLIRGGRIVDGMGTPAFVGDIAIKDGVIQAVGGKLGGFVRQLVNTALRRGISGPAPRRAKAAYSCPTFSMGVPQVNLDKALALAAGLEDAEVLRELELRK
jgi:hypothetical protein